MNSFEREIFDDVKALLEKTVENTALKIEITESDDEVVHAYIENIGNYDGAIMTELNFVDVYKDKEVETLQFFSSLSADIDEKLYAGIEKKINQLNSMMVFGSFGLYPDAGQIFHRYVLPVQKGNREINNLNIKVVWDEIWSSLEYLLPFILLISYGEEDVDLDLFMEAFK